MDLTLTELTDLWNKWSRDHELKHLFRFGQFVLNRKAKAGFTWPLCYYASTEQAYQLLYKYTQTGEK